MPFDDFEHLERLSAVFRRAQVLDDLNNDMAGRETGRIRRVVHGDVGERVEERKRQQRQDSLLIETALDAMLRDPVYRARYEAFGAFLDTYETATQTALERAAELSDAAQATLTTLSEAASTLDGQPVFVSEDARIVDADGLDIDPADAERVIWREGAPGYEEYATAKDAAEDAKQTLEDIEAYQAELDDARQRWADEDAPMTKDEMDALEKDLKESAPEMVRRIEREVTHSADSKTNLEDVGALSLKG